MSVAFPDVCDGSAPSRPQFQPLEQQPSSASSSATLAHKATDTRRVIHINRQQECYYKSNAVSTTKYQLWSFVPRFLYEQFRRYSNCFFLLIACLQQIPDVSPTGRWTTLIPLTFILMVSAVKEVIEDTKRRIADTKINWRKSYVLRGVNFVPSRWYDIRVGDIVKVTNGEPLPADLIILSSSEPQGIAYIETANLDGETNLKIRQALPETWSLTTNENSFCQFRGIIECEPPNKRLYEYSGSLQQLSPTDGTFIGVKRPLGADQMLLRGSRLLNTDVAYGVVIYTGHESKVMLNALRTVPLKRSSMERLVNAQILLLFCILFGIVLISAVCYGVWLKWYVNDAWYLKSVIDSQYRKSRTIQSSSPVNIDIDVDTKSNLEKVLFSTMTFVILYNNLIPISLQVTLELVRFFQAYFIGWDKDMCDKETKTYAQARTSTLNEELGQVKYIFSDKTGTLTENKMVFRACSIAGFRFGTTSERLPLTGNSEATTTTGVSGSMHANIINSNPTSYSDDFFNEHLHNILFYGVDGMMPQLHTPPQTNVAHARDVITTADTITTDENDLIERVDMIRLFAVALAVCHTVLPEAGESENSPNYLASSPDELALVKASSTIGYKLVRRTPDEVELKIVNELESPDGITLKYEILNIIEFSSDRKRMSLICRDKQTNRILLFCKGADTVITERLRQPVQAQKYLEATVRDLEDFAAEGYRTLCISYAVLDAQRYSEWNETLWKPASTAVFDRARMVAHAAEFIERDLILLGATAIEDQLQEDVPDTIESLFQAGMSLWVLTGDHQSTAINIGHACRLLQRDVEPIIINERSLDDTRTRILHVIASCRDVDARSLVIDGSALQFALHENLRQDFYSLAVRCRSVICCRVSPMQKAEVVSLVKHQTPKGRFLGHQIGHCTTLAIGDGANDVAMIQAAHIGIGISGREGMAAVCASDYAISQFRFLKKLLLVHGAWSHERLSKLILYSFYKNICLYLMQFGYAMSSAYSGQTLFERWTIGLYNVLFTAAPPFVIGLFDRTCSIESRMLYPKLYEPSQHGRLFNIQIFWLWVIKAVVHAAVIYLLSRAACHTDVLWGSGHVNGGLLIGAMIMTYTIITVCLKAALETQIWTWPAHVGIWGSIAAWFVFFVVYSQVWPTLDIGENMTGMVSAMFSSWIFWFGLVLIPVAALLPDLTWKILFNSFWPRLSDSIRHMECVGGRYNIDINYSIPPRSPQVLSDNNNYAGGGQYNRSISNINDNNNRATYGQGGGSTDSSNGSNPPPVNEAGNNSASGGHGATRFLRQRIAKVPPETTSLLGMQPIYYRTAGAAGSAPVLQPYAAGAAGNATHPGSVTRASTTTGGGSIMLEAAASSATRASLPRSMFRNSSSSSSKPQRAVSMVTPQRAGGGGNIPLNMSTSAIHGEFDERDDENDDNGLDRKDPSLEVYKRGFAFSQDESNTVAQSQYVRMYGSTDNLHHHTQPSPESFRQPQRVSSNLRDSHMSHNNNNNNKNNGRSSSGGNFPTVQVQSEMDVAAMRAKKQRASLLQHQAHSAQASSASLANSSYTDQSIPRLSQTQHRAA